jgi:hypothetical protein
MQSANRTLKGGLMTAAIPYANLKTAVVTILVEYKAGEERNVCLSIERGRPCTLANRSLNDRFLKAAMAVLGRFRQFSC